MDDDAEADVADVEHAADDPTEDPTDDPARAHLAHNPVGLDVLARVRAALTRLGIPATERVTRSQIAFRTAGPSGRDRGFAWIWDPERYQRRSDGPLVVLTVALARPLDSPRIKESVHPSARQWVHHLEIHDAGEVDLEVVDWLDEAVERLP